MRKKTDRNKPIGKLHQIDDFLPSPEKLVAVEKTQKITIALNTSTIEFFKNAAEKNDTKYQKMIRRLLEKYVRRYSQAS